MKRLEEKEKYGMLTVLERVEAPENMKDKKSIYFLCKCDCGNEKVVRKSSLTKGVTVSCGCYHSKIQKERPRENKTHGLSKTRFYGIWSHMRNRCNNPKYSEYHLYGGRGITVCERWETFENFMLDMYYSYLSFESKHGKGTASIDRKDSNGNYEPDNCEWKTQQEQQRNKRNNVSVEVNGVKYSTLKELSEVSGIYYQTIIKRYNAGKRGNDLIKPTKK